MSITPKRSDLDGLALQVFQARDYQEHLEQENRRLAQLEEEKDTRVIELEHELEAVKISTVPRIITAEELRHGMVVAVADHGDHGLRWEATMALDTNLSLFEEKPRIVLLEDAPAEAPEPAEDSPKRLTVADLEAAPVGSVLSIAGVTRTKYSFGWSGFGVSSEWIWSAFPYREWVDATLTPPGKPELPTEPGSVILVTEWRGEKLDTPIYAVADRDGVFWYTSGHTFPDGCDYADPDEITGFRPARIVLEDGE